MTSPNKEFVIRHVTDALYDLEFGRRRDVKEHHYGTSWTLQYHLNCSDFEFYLWYDDDEVECKDPNWSMDVDVEFKLFLPNGDVTSSKQKRVFSSELLLAEFQTKLDDPIVYDSNETFTLEIHVKMGKNNGPERKDLIKFDESVKQFSDVVLVVDERKFYVSKMTLAFQSSYFNSLLMGGFEESEKTEVILKDIDPNDFQHFLELIHGASLLNDNTIEGILHLVDMYDVPIALRRCEEFLLEKSQKKREIKLKLAIQYKLEFLKKKCLSEITTKNDIRAIVDAGLDKLDSSVSNDLLYKLLRI